PAVDGGDALSIQKSGDEQSDCGYTAHDYLLKSTGSEYIKLAEFSKRLHSDLSTVRSKYQRVKLMNNDFCETSVRRAVGGAENQDVLALRNILQVESKSLAGGIDDA